eukprot:2907772-Amphidinium_carterae.1
MSGSHAYIDNDNILEIHTLRVACTSLCSLLLVDSEISLKSVFCERPLGCFQKGMNTSSFQIAQDPKQND